MASHRDIRAAAAIAIDDTVTDSVKSRGAPDVSRNVSAIRCHHCREPIGPTALVYRPLPGGYEGTYCATCFPQHGVRPGRGRDWNKPLCDPKPCACCRRPVRLPDSSRRVCCSEACDRRFSRQRRRRRNCTHCGLMFDPARSDARYCCAGCKQAAYRGRLARQLEASTQAEE